ncbi:MAG: ABC transporter permease [Bacteroidales bacterium]|nr:ABC transporter permease [Bacteroidales bacterium]
MKIIFRNIVSIVRRFKAAWIMNILGVSSALTALMFVAMQISYEVDYDKCHTDADRIFRLTQEELTYPFSIVQARGNINAAGNLSPKVEAHSICLEFNDNNIEVEASDGSVKGFYESTAGVDADFVKIFTFDVICGDPECLKTQGNAYIPESTAMKIFGTTDVIGKRIKLDQGFGTSDGMITIGAVYKDFPTNTQTNNDIYFSFDNTNSDNYQSRSFVGWLKLTSPDDKADVERLMQTQMVKLYNGETDFTLVPLPEIFYKNEGGDGQWVKSGSLRTTATLAIISIIVLIISMINHTNFSIAMIPMRIRSICLQKVIGAEMHMLRRMLLAESVIIGCLCWLMSLLFVKLLGGTWITQFFTPDDLSISGNLAICLGAGVVAVAVSLLASVYPVMKITSVNPAIALKGSFGHSQSGRRLRTVLLMFQFFAAICFITVAVCIWRQINYMTTSNQIISADQVAVFKASSTFSSQHDAVVEELKSFSGIEGVAFSMQQIGGSDTFNHEALLSPSGDTIMFQCIMVTNGITDVFDIKLAEGLGFSSGRTDGDPRWDFYRGEAVLTPELARRLNKNVGDEIGINSSGVSLNVKAITEDDVRVTSFRLASEPLMFVSCGYQYMSYAYVRLAKGCNVREAVDHIEKTVEKFAPGMPFDIEFYDKVFQKLYQQEINMSATTAFLAILAVIISMIGVFCMVLFDTEYKRREIAVRKVFGASSFDILKRNNIRYVMQIVLALVLSLPVSLYVIINWQKSFAEKADMPWWIFTVVALCVALVTTLIVTLQSAKSICSNPVDSLKNE